MAEKIITDTSRSATRELEILLDPQEIQERMDRVARSLQRRVKIRGFRPGKAPLEVVKTMYREEIRSQAFEDVLKDKILEEAKLRNLQIVGPIHLLEQKEEDGQIKVRTRIEVIPHFEFPPIQEISVKRKVTRVTEAEVERRIQGLRESLAEFEAKDGKTEPGDYVFVDYEERDEKGKVRDRLKNAYIVLDPERTNPKIVEQLLDKQPGDVVEIPMTFQDEQGNEVQRTFIYKIRSIKHRVLPEVDDDFAQMLGYENVEDLFKKIREELEERAREDSERDVENQIIQEVYQRIQFEVPPTLVQERIEILKNQLDPNFLQNLEKPEEFLQAVATNQIIREILLDRYAEKMNIEPTEEEIQEEIERRAKEYRVPPEKYREALEKKNNLGWIKTVIRRRKAMEQMKNLVKLEVIVE